MFCRPSPWTGTNRLSCPQRGGAVCKTEQFFVSSLPKVLSARKQADGSETSLSCFLVFFLSIPEDGISAN
jgi:hypothetical protein